MSFLTLTGLRVRRAYEILQNFRQTYELESGESPDWDRDTFLGAISAAFASVEGETNEGLQAVWDSFDPDNAQGAALDTHAKLAGIYRQAATQSSVTLRLTGNPGTFVPQGRVVEDVNGERWVTQSDIQIPFSITFPPLPGIGTARAENFGPIFANPGEITTIITPVAGWTAVTNPSAAVPGSNRQDDGALRRARVEALRSGAKTSYRGIQQALSELPFLESVGVIHNPSSVTATVQGIVLPRNSFKVIAFPNTITLDEKDELWEAILANSPIGIESTGAEVTTIDGYPVKFDFATAFTVNVAVVVTIDTSNYAAPGVLAEIQTVITNYINGLRVGATVRRLEICRLLAGIEGVLTLNTLTINSGSTDLALNADRYPVAGTISATEAP
jgi:uncharacterized phage protein gp47/JayE